MPFTVNAHGKPGPYNLALSTNAPAITNVSAAVYPHKIAKIPLQEIRAGSF
jgi:hypothetical protein